MNTSFSKAYAYYYLLKRSKSQITTEKKVVVRYGI